ncbi:pumilio homolog 3-like isoform X2 [Biomphalaria glabrata]|nr:pumilio homolog 3-like isoform X2 [Biomphalaria glabrata]XP_055885158.1 pumilio homolog 3-like isoform X2 [Biomphalaria glabrata]
MKNKSASPAVKKSSSVLVRRGGFGLAENKGQGIKNVSMTPDTFERSQSKIKKAGVKRRKSLYGCDTSQVEDTSQLSQNNSILERTPVTLSQISIIDPSENDTLTTTFRKKHQPVSDDTLELAVHYARGEPDGAERSFTRKQLSQMCIDDGSDNKDNGNEDVEDCEMESESENEAPSPSKKSKLVQKEIKTPKAEKGKKTNLKMPFKQAAKKLKSLKGVVDSKKGKKQDKKDFGPLPDETTVPKTPNQTRKEVKQQRKMVKNNYELIENAKKFWEELRRHDLPDTKRRKICDDLMKLVTGKIKELSAVHDSARVIQCLVQYGTEEQRNLIFEELKDDICDLCKLKYAKYVVRKLIKYGTKELRGQLFAKFHGQVRKLIKHKEASDIIEYAFNDFATAPQRLAILEEFYGPTFTLFKEHSHQTLDQIMTEQPEKKEMVIRSMREALLPLIDKEILSYSLVHKVFHDFFTYADDKSKREMIDGLKEHVPNLLHTKDGTRVAMHFIWHGSAKDRKIIIKSLKSHVVKICKEEHGHLLLMAIFDSVDDTVLVQKAIIDEMVKSLDQVVHDQHGRKVLLYLLFPRDPHHFHPDIVNILKEGDGNATSKKDKVVRAKELCDYVSPHLIKYLENNALTMMSNSNHVLLVKAIITNASGDVVPAMRAIAELVAQPCSTADGAINMIEHPACHIALKKIIANDKTRMEAGNGILFSAILLEALPKSTIKVWAASNRGCFILVSLLEVGCSTITEKVSNHLQPVTKSLSKMTFKGAELLLEKLKNPNKSREFRV